MDSLKLKQSFDINEYKSLMDGLYNDFGESFIKTCNHWCDARQIDYKGRFWEIWLVYLDDNVIGICGLYSVNGTTNELWLGWFGIIPEYRNKKIGEDVLTELKKKAKDFGAEKIMSYVDKNGRPLSFYYRNGFKRISTVKEYLEVNVPLANEYDFNDLFEDMEDQVIMFEI